jgi:hypothetical protein
MGKNQYDEKYIAQADTTIRQEYMAWRARDDSSREKNIWGKHGGTSACPI